MKNNIHKMYTQIIKKKLYLKFAYKNINQIPKISKIVLSCGLGIRTIQLEKLFKKYIDDIKKISGQHPKITRAKKAVSNFKIRKNMPLGLMVTLRKEKMYSFLEKVIKLVIPKMRNSNILSEKSFDKFGNLSLGINDFSLFPETQDDISNNKLGFNITIVTSAKTLKESVYLLKQLGFPIIEEN
jgi:large subunit ribosomal protein L5